MDILETLNNLQTATEKNIEKKQDGKKTEYYFDKLKMYFGDDYTFQNGITVSIPKIGEIVKVGESNFYQALSPFLKNPTSVRLLLYNVFHKDWNKTEEIYVFYILLQLLQNKEPLKLVFKDINFEDFELVKTTRIIEGEECENLAVYSPSQNIFIYENEYIEIAEYIRAMLNIHPKVEKAKGKTTKLWMLEEDKLKAQQQIDKDDNFSLFSYISSCVNHPGFKYNLEEVRQMNICQFMDSVQRIQKYENGIAALHGAFGGFVSAKDIPQEVINFMSEI